MHFGLGFGELISIKKYSVEGWAVILEEFEFESCYRLGEIKLKQTTKRQGWALRINYFRHLPSTFFALNLQRKDQIPVPSCNRGCPNSFCSNVSCALTQSVYAQIPKAELFVQQIGIHQLVPNIDCCILIPEKKPLSLKNDLPFISGRCCHLMLRLHLMRTN